MSRPEPPTVLLLDGDHDYSLQIAKELSVDLGGRIVGVGTSRFSRLFYSRYCDRAAVLPEPDAPGYDPALLSLVDDLRPDVVLPLGHASVVAVDSIRDRVPDDVGLVMPPSETLEVAVDKRRTLSRAAEHGLEVPTDFTAEVEAMDAAGRDPGDLERLPFPLFVKAGRETGRTLSAKVRTPASFWEAYDEIERSADGSPIVQECVEGDGATYGCGVLFVDGRPELSFSHVERRSVPRRGGSGTRLAVFDDHRLESTTEEFLEGLDWSGVALVEYRWRGDSYVLMEINARFWASYALASQCGYRFASALVAAATDRRPPERPRNTDGERVFPLRELAFCAADRDESLVEGAIAMGYPPAPPAFNAEDAVAWLVPPTNVVRTTAAVRSALRTVGRFWPFGPTVRE